MTGKSVTDESLVLANRALIETHNYKILVEDGGHSFLKVPKELLTDLSDFGLQPFSGQWKECEAIGIRWAKGKWLYDIHLSESNSLGGELLGFSFI